MKEDDEDIIRDIGNCLIQTHNFKKAVEYYRDCI